MDVFLQLKMEWEQLSRELYVLFKGDDRYESN